MLFYMLNMGIKLWYPLHSAINYIKECDEDMLTPMLKYFCVLVCMMTIESSIEYVYDSAYL